MRVCVRACVRVRARVWWGGGVYVGARNGGRGVVPGAGVGAVAVPGGVTKAVAVARVPFRLVLLVLRWPLPIDWWILATTSAVQAVVPGAVVAAWAVLLSAFVVMASTFGVASAAAEIIRWLWR